MKTHCKMGTYEHSIVLEDKVFCDKCLVEEIQKLRKAGINTIASCCGHGNQAIATICVDEKDIWKMQELDYKKHGFGDREDIFRAKTMTV